MSYQEIKKISKGRLWMIMILIFCSVLFGLFRKMAFAQKINESAGNVSATESNWTCSQSYTYTTEFSEFVSKFSDISKIKIPLGDLKNQVNKCDTVFADLKKTGYWDGRFIYTEPPPARVEETSASPCSSGPCGGACGGSACSACACSACGTPPAELLECGSLDDCLNKGAEFSLDSVNGTGKGIFAEPISLNFKEISGSPYITCSNNSCIPYSSGNYIFQEKANATKFYGQCKDTASGTIVKTQGDVSEVTNQSSISVVNLPPVATVSFESSPTSINEEIIAHCDIVDPDECSDKIREVKWTCLDSEGNKSNCFVSTPENGIWYPGTIVQSIDPSKQANPYRSTVKVKLAKYGSYALICEAWDNDPVNSLSGRGLKEINLVNKDVVAAKSDSVNPIDSKGQQDKTCAPIPKSGLGNPICLNSSEVTYEAVSSGIDADLYKWKCGIDSKEDWTETENKDFKCLYGKAGAYKPSLQLYDEDLKKWIPCNSWINTDVLDKARCSVEVKIVGSESDFSENLSVKAGDEIEAKIIKECSDGSIKWETEGNQTKLDEKRIKVKFNTSGTKDIKASVGNLSCNPAKVNIKELVKWGQ